MKTENNIITVKTLTTTTQREEDKTLDTIKTIATTKIETIDIDKTTAMIETAAITIIEIRIRIRVSNGWMTRPIRKE